jgi:hypothetical protein
MDGVISAHAGSDSMREDRPVASRTFPTRSRPAPPENRSIATDALGALPQLSNCQLHQQTTSLQPRHPEPIKASTRTELSILRSP